MWPFNKKSNALTVKGAGTRSSFRISDLLPSWSFSPSWTNWSSQKAIRDGFESNVWVYACMKKRMQAAASVPICVMNKDKEKQEDHALAQLLKNPNPEIDAAKMIEIIVSSLDAGGNSYWHIVRGGPGGKVPLELWPIPQDAITPVHVQGTHQYISYYRYDWKGAVKNIPAEDMIHLMYTHPEDRFCGIAPLKAAGRSVDVDNEAASWQKVSLQNRGVPDGVFNMKGDEIGPREYEEARRQVKEQYTSQASAREPWVLANVEWSQMSLSPAELDYSESRKLTREEICAAFEVPPPMVGIYDKATLSNIETARKIFWRDTIVPLINQLASALTSRLVKDFGGNGHYVEFDTSNVSALRDSLNEKLDAAKKLQGLGIPLTVINDRLELGLDIDKIPDADIGYLPSGLIPTGGDLPFGEPSEEEAEQLRALAYGQSKS